MREDLGDHRRVFDRSDDLQGPATEFAVSSAAVTLDSVFVLTGGLSAAKARPPTKKK